MQVDVDTREYIEVLKDLTEQGQEVSLTVYGTSMEPFLKHKRDRVSLRRPENPLRKGDLVFYQRRSGEYIMHRIVNIKEHQYYLAGDHHTCIEGPVERQQIFAVVTGVQRKGRWMTENHRVWKFYSRWWRWLLPLRRIGNRLRHGAGNLYRRILRS